jgi:hypothetical protein
MTKRVLNIDTFLVFITVFTMAVTATVPSITAETSKTYVEGFDRGVSWRSYIPLKKAVFVDFIENGYLDDYAYLAAVPTSVFYDKNNEKIFTNPLLFYQEEYFPTDEKKRALNARQGIDYFMEDWVSYCGHRLDQIVGINIDEGKLAEWPSIKYTAIEGKNPFEIAGKIALHDWSYSDDAVIAVIEEAFEKPDNKTHGTINGAVPVHQGVLTYHFEIPQTNDVYPIYNEFKVPSGYKFIKVRSWYPCFYVDIGLPIPGFESVVNTTTPPGDRDLQIYCEENGQWMMAGITSAWNALRGMDHDKTSVYVYKSGRWSVALTDVPTKRIDFGLFDDNVKGLEVQKHRRIFSIGFGRYGRIIDILKNMRQVIYQVDVEIFPGVTVEIPDLPPFGCRNAYFKLTWNDPSADLGFSLIGPSGEEVLSTREPGVSSTCYFSEDEEGIPLPEGTETDMCVERLGECLPNERYSISVFAMNELATPVDFIIEYTWEQNITRRQGDGFASATEGAVLASLLNAPLLYTSSHVIPAFTRDVLYRLGVKNLYIVDLGGYLSRNSLEQLKEIATIRERFIGYDQVYRYIRSITGRNDVIFSTIDPWSFWYVGDLEAAGEMTGALYIGPAAYIAAHHGSPVLLIDNHPHLSSSVIWHNEFWRRHPDGISKLPTVSEMYFTGKRVYDFLKDQGYDKEGEETIVTVGGQFDIGLTWDRVFVGKGIPGRFIGSPVDISVWISKTVFYPQLIFENPALKKPGGVTLINGSCSRRRFPWRGKLGLRIIKPSQLETFKYPVLNTLICYDHKFNSRASKYWGFKYKCADGTVPGETPSTEPIDEGVMEQVNGAKGAFFPDLSGSEVQPFYLKKAGYDPVFSTNFTANMYNLNQGVVLWLLNTHGGPFDGGLLMFWDVEGKNPRGYPTVPLAGYNKEVNPWRGYEWWMGSTEEPDTMSGGIHGVLAALAGNPDPKGMRIFTSALDWALAKRPIRDIVGKLFNLPILGFFAPEWFKDTEDYYDGVIITVFLGRFGTSWYDGIMIDDALGNIHSVGVSSVACLPAGKYLHLALMRHGSVFQIMDPWVTSWYSDVWQNSVPRGIALGKTIGEIYSEGISKVGILYISEPPQWWWDLAENVCLYGDPDLRVWVPSTEFSVKNHWDDEDVKPLREIKGFYADGHVPFGALKYPNARRPVSLLEKIFWIIAIVVVLAAIIIGVVIFLSKKQSVT